MDLLTDEQLLSLAGQGSEAAYGALYDRYYIAARRLARYLGARDEAEDIVQQVFSDSWRLVQKGSGPKSYFRAYIFTGVRNATGQWGKKSQRVILTDEEHRLDRVEQFGGSLPPEERQAVRAAYESLPEDRWRNVLWALDVDGYKPSEIAEMFGMTPNAVSALAYRARTALRAAYYALDEDPQEVPT